MNIFQKLYWTFSPYTDPQEKKIARFFESALRESSAGLLEHELKTLMQEDLIRLNLYQERLFKGYKNITKWKRKRLYQNAFWLKSLFKNFVATSPNIHIPKALQDLSVSQEKKHVLACILQFLSPEQYYQYEKSAAFSKLLRDPRKETIIGDCNQICTLYLALYALKFSVSDFQVRILKDHICLHYQGIDIEATSGTITHYSEGKILPVTELISTNILDVSDTSESQQKVSARNFAKAAKCVFAISSEKAIAQHNLFVAYHNLGTEALKRKRFEKAFAYFSKSHAPEQAQNVWKSAVKHFLQEKNFSKALSYAKKSQEKNLRTIVLKNEALHLIEKKNYSKAQQKLSVIGDQKSLQFLWKKQLFELNESLKNCKKVSDFRQKKSTLKKMKSLAQKTHQSKIIAFCDNILKHL